jgi:lysyl-tRNA synthetase class 2
LIVGGFEKIYEVGRCFRNEGIDYAHNPEFTMLELYWAFAEKESFISLLENLLMTVIREAIDPLANELKNAEIQFVAPFPRLTFRQAILSACGIDIDLVTEPDSLIALCKEKGIFVDFTGCIGMGEYYDALWKNTARPNVMQPTWIFDYPTSLKPLAKAKQEDPTKSACVQLVIQGAEVINAYYDELNDPVDQRNRFEEQQTLREKGSEEAQWMDEAFLSALEHGMPPTSGVGIGIDRLIAFLTNAPNLKEVILFPTLKQRNQDSSDV